MNIEICRANMEDAPVIHELMMKAFEEYSQTEHPSSALQETVDSIKENIMSGNEAALIVKEGETFMGMVRYKLEGNHLFFYRLSIIPEARGRGLAKVLLNALEEAALEEGKGFIYCKVRANVSRNVTLYESVGYAIIHEEFVHKPNSTAIPVYTMEKAIDGS